MRIERIGDATLILADCRDVLPGLQADVICSDFVSLSWSPNTGSGSHDLRFLAKLLPDMTFFEFAAQPVQQPQRLGCLLREGLAA